LTCSYSAKMVRLPNKDSILQLYTLSGASLYGNHEAGFFVDKMEG